MFDEDYSSIADYADLNGDGKVDAVEYMLDEDDYEMIMGKKNGHYDNDDFDDDDEFDFDFDDDDDDDDDDEFDFDDNEGDDY